MTDSGNTHTISVGNRRRSRWLAAGGVALTLAIAGCGSTYSAGQPAAPRSTTSGPSTTPASSTAAARVSHEKAATTAGPTKSRHASAPAAPAPAGGTRTSTAPAPAPTESAGIPQNNGGDHDADNNGGPSDGDGNV